MIEPVFRFAPSPNGYLHLGHAYSALLNARLAHEVGGRFLVRIEDIDTTRCTRELAVRALEDLSWLGLSWEEPVRYQSEHLPDYHAAADQLAGLGLLYPCFCSRREVAMRCKTRVRDPDGQPLYDGSCRQLDSCTRRRRIDDGIPHALRLDMTSACELAGGNTDAGRWGDVVLVRRDIGTSYHIAVVTDDAIQGITHVVRGKDLEQATSIHRLLQRLLGLHSPAYFHHELVSDDAGHKLAKSAGSRSLRSLRAESVTSEQVRSALGFT